MGLIKMTKALKITSGYILLYYWLFLFLFCFCNFRPVINSPEPSSAGWMAFDENVFLCVHERLQ